MMNRSILRAQLNAVLPNGVVLHASVVAEPGGAYVFLAPSGGGKSTVMSVLTKKHFGAIADDSVVIARGTDGVIRCLPCGTMKQNAGTEKIDPAPLKTFFFLEKKGPILKTAINPRYAFYRSMRCSSIMALDLLPREQRRQARIFLEKLFYAFPSFILRYDTLLHPSDILTKQIDHAGS
jgi:hypothetical protein